MIERTGVLIDCLDKCGVDEHCDGINYNGVKHICVGIESDANVPDPGGHFIKLPTPRNNETESFLLRPNAAVGYFESLCLEGNFLKSIVEFNYSTIVKFLQPQRAKLRGVRKEPQDFSCEA